MGGAGLGEDRPDQGNVGEVLDAEQPGAQPVVDVVVVVSDVVGERRHLGLGAGIGIDLQVVRGDVFGDHPGNGGGAARTGERAVVLDHPFQGLPGEVEAGEMGVAFLEVRHHPQRLGVVVEAAEGLHLLFQGVLAGVAEGRVAEVVGQGQGLGQVLVEAEIAAHRARDLGNLQRMGKPGAEEVALVVDEDLGLVSELAEGPWSG